jgi:hypothetical protein
MPFFVFSGVGERNQQGEEVFLNKRDRCTARQAKWREIVCNYDKEILKTWKEKIR